MVKKHKNIKEIAYRIGLGGLLLLNVITTSLAQEGTINNKPNGEIPNKPSISDKVNTTEQPDISDKIEIIEKEPDFKDISNQINKSFQEYLANSFEIGKWSGYKETTNGIDNYIIEGLGIFSKCEIESDGPPNCVTIANYAISKGFDGAVSFLQYGPSDRDFCIKSRENKGNGIWMVYYKKNEKNTKSSTQDKEE